MTVSFVSETRSSILLVFQQLSVDGYEIFTERICDHKLLIRHIYFGNLPFVNCHTVD